MDNIAGIESEKRGLETRRKKRPKKHLKCDFKGPICGRCEKDGEICIRGAPKIKFRHGSSARYDSGFSKNQIWMKTKGTADKLDYIDETADIAAFYAQDQATIDTDSDTNPEQPDDALSRQYGHSLGESSPSLHRGSGPMGPPSPIRNISRSINGFTSPLKRRRTSTIAYTSETIQTSDNSTSVPALSPALSWLNLHSPTHYIRRPSSAPDNLIAGDVNFDIGLSPFPDTSLIFSQIRTPRTDAATINPASAALENVPSTPSYHMNPYSPNLHQPPLEGESWPNETWTWTSPTLRESILMRYFTDHLAHWFDLCDQERHFQLVVPQRARHCPPLLNAIFTTSARHLTRLSRYKSTTVIDGVQRPVVVFGGNVLPDLKIETAIQYHNESIKDLIQLSMDPDQVHNEDLLAAAIILRFYEEVDTPLRVGITEETDGSDVNDMDGELFLKVTNTFLNAQQPTLAQLPHTSPVATLNLHQIERRDSAGFPVFGASPSSIATPPAITSHHHHSASISSNDPIPRVPKADGLRQACFWVAFRQEITVAFLKQRPFGISLSRCAAFRSFSPAEDAIWADRLIIFCADVLEFCYGSSESDHNSDTVTMTDVAKHRRGKNEERERWDRFQATLQKFSKSLPRSFEPIYFRPPDPAHGEVFPEVWYLDAVHVTGIQHVELARILLAASNPYMPKLGPGHVAAVAKLSRELKSIVLRLCGIAMSNRRTPPGLVTAFMSIAMCGEYFAEKAEQRALMDVIQLLESEHAWPTERTANVLRKAWGWDD